MIVDDYSAIAAALKAHEPEPRKDDPERLCDLIHRAAAAWLAAGPPWVKPNEGKYVAAFDELANEWAARRKLVAAD